MIPDPLPPELLALERELADRPRPTPPAGLRTRVLAAARRERPDAARMGFARFTAAVAAAVLLAINLSASLANDTDWHLRPATGGADVADVAGHLRDLAPDFSEREARRQALLLRAAANLVPAPVPARHTLWNKDLERWDTR